MAVRFIAVLELSASGTPPRIVLNPNDGSQVSYGLSSVIGSGKIYWGSKALQSVRAGKAADLSPDEGDFQRVTDYQALRIVLGEDARMDRTLVDMHSVSEGDLVLLECTQDYTLNRKAGRKEQRTNVDSIKVLEKAK